MNRRGFISGIAGLVAGGVVVPTSPAVTRPETVKLRTVLMDARNYRDFIKSSESEQVLVNPLTKHGLTVRKAL